MNCIGNEAVQKRTLQLIQKERVPHLLLFSGPDGVGKKLFAKTFAATWLSHISSKKIAVDHPDISVAVPEGKVGMHSIHSIRRLIDEIALSPFDAQGKVVIIDDAERMLATSANTLLKTIEEPPKNRLIILISSKPDRLLETITSRCQEVRFSALSTEEVTQYLIQHHHPTIEDAKSLGFRARGSIGEALRLSEKNLDDVHVILFDLMSSGGFTEFHRLSHSCAQLQKLLDEKKKGKEQLLRKELHENMKELSATQKQQLDQEIEGAVSLLWMQDVQSLLHDITAYFRDLYSLHSSVNHPALFFAHKKELLLQAYDRGDAAFFEGIDTKVCEAKQALERSTPLQHVLESLFLQMTI